LQSGRNFGALPSFSKEVFFTISARDEKKMTSVQDMFSLSGHTAVVTGGTRGIGQAVAIALAEAGADILLIQVWPTSPLSA
jgi:hypothetical protein